MTDWQGRATSYAYDANSMLVQTKRPDGTIETRDYDQAERLSSIVDRTEETIINSYFYSYDAVGNIVSVSSKAKEVKQQGGNGQLQASQGQSTVEQTVSGDVQSAGVSNTSSSKINVANVQNVRMEYDSTNRLIKYNGETVKYDADGNMVYGPLNGEMTTFVYDCRNRLIQAGNTTYQHNGENFHFNHLGSTTAVTDEKGTVKYQYQYSPYGELIEGTYGQVAFLYNGKYGVTSDDNGLYYMRARYYNIDIKRFINQDVVTGSIERSGSLNRYAYVEGNPVNYIDPFGLEKRAGNDDDSWIKHDSGLFLYKKTSVTQLKIKNDVAFLNKNMCIKVAEEIVSDKLIKDMDVTSIAAEIYFHTFMWQGLDFSKEWKDQGWLKGLIYKQYDSATDIDLDDGGDPRLYVQIGMWAVW